MTHELLATVFPESREEVDDALERQGWWDGELRHTRNDGEVIVVASRQALQRGDDRRPLAIIAVNSDITERKRAEQQLAETAGLLERTAQTSKTGGWEYDLATGRLTWTDEVYPTYGGERTSGPVGLEQRSRPSTPTASRSSGPRSSGWLRTASPAISRSGWSAPMGSGSGSASSARR